MKKKNFLNGTLLLALSGFVSKLLGAVYRIPLTNILGAEGIGLYQLVFPIYALVITVSSGAVPVIVSRLVAEENALADGAGNALIFNASARLLLLSGAFGALFTAAMSLPFALMQGERGIASGYLFISPAVFFAAASAVFKGWFTGNADMRPSAAAQFSEQLVKMGAGLTLAVLLSKYSAMWAVRGALAAITVSEAASFVAYYSIYLKKGRRPQVFLKEERRDAAKEILKLSLPVLGAEIILPLSAFADSVVIVNLLKSSIGAARATAEYGLLTGPVNSLVNLPVILAIALSVAVVPVISRQRALLDARAAKSKSTTSLKIALAVGFPAAAALAILARPCIQLLYPGFDAAQVALCSKLLAVSAVNALLLSLLQIYNSLLQALDKSRFPLYSLGMGALFKLALEFALIPKIGIVGAAAAGVAGYALSALADGLYYRYLLGANENLRQSVGKILLSGVIMGIAVAAALYLEHAVLQILTAAAGGLAVYVAAVLASGAFDGVELAGMPLGRLLAKRRNK